MQFRNVKPREGVWESDDLKFFCKRLASNKFRAVYGPFRRRRFRPGVYAGWVEGNDMHGVSPVYGAPA